MKRLLYFITAVFTFEAVADGGVSSMAGLGEVMALIGSSALVVLTWLTFSLFLLFGRKTRMSTVYNFRKTIWVSIVLGHFVILWVTLRAYSPSWQILAVFTLLSASIVGLTELQARAQQKRCCDTDNSHSQNRGMKER